jgi:uncharacterized protein YciI
MPKYVLFYESAADVRSRAPQHFPAHLARWKQFQAKGTLLMIGTFGNPQDGRPLRPERRCTALVHPGMERGDRPLIARELALP